MAHSSARVTVPGADGRRVTPVVRSIAGTSATKAQIRRKTVMRKVLGEGTPTVQPVRIEVKRAAKPKKLSTAHTLKLRQQKRFG